MIRGTDAEFIFTLSCNYSDLLGSGWVNIIFWQEDNNGVEPYGTLPIIKKLEHCSSGNKSNQLKVRLSQTETLRFSHEHKAYTQLTGVTNTNKPIMCKKKNDNRLSNI